jgi:pimeloyl-ACP methyl ester carboxylesterase
MAARGLDVFQFLRPRGNDPLVGSGEGLARGLASLRAAGYRRIVVAGHSRGAWIALTALAHPGLADSIVAVSVAAHGTRPERQTQARADWQALWASASAAPTRVVLVQLCDDPYDPDPTWRLEVAKASVARAGLRLLSVFLPPVPRGHVGFYESEFDGTLGAAIADFADPR